MTKLSYLRHSLTFHVGRSAFFLLILICIGGCESHKEPRIEVREVVLETPSGEHRFDANDVGDRVHIQRPSLSITVRTPVLGVTLAPIAQNAGVRVAPKQRDRRVQFESLGAFYQRDGKKEIPLHGTQRELRLAGGEWFASKWQIDLPPPLSQVSLTMSSPPPYMIEAIEALEGETLRFSPAGARSRLAIHFRDSDRSEWRRHRRQAHGRAPLQLLGQVLLTGSDESVIWS